jgi:toxin ParE1/3/4
MTTRPAVVRKLPSAQLDLVDVWLFIAADSPVRADRMLDTIDEKLRLLAESPAIGRERPELAAGLRSLPCGSYQLYYRASADGIDLVRVIHAARDLGTLFHDEPF